MGTIVCGTIRQLRDLSSQQKPRRKAPSIMPLRLIEILFAFSGVPTDGRLVAALFIGKGKAPKCLADN